jgi:hypothetical protein
MGPRKASTGKPELGGQKRKREKRKRVVVKFLLFFLCISGVIGPSRGTATNTYEGHTFFFTNANGDRVETFTMVRDSPFSPPHQTKYADALNIKEKN